MPKLALSLLGAPLLELEGKPVHVDTRKAIAMLAYLAMTRQPHSRDTLAALLWPDYSQTNARAALRRTISALHRSLGEPLLESRQELLHLPNSAGLCVDSWEFQRCLAECETHPHPSSQACPQCLPWLAKAASLYRDTFMAGFSLRDSSGFDDWQFFQSETLRRDLGSVLERLVQGYADLGNFETAIGYAKRWLSLDALHEPAHRQLMQLYALSGQRNAALRQYQECVRILDKELGVPPLEETSRLFQEIKEQTGISAATHQKPVEVYSGCPRRSTPTNRSRALPIRGYRSNSSKESTRIALAAHQPGYRVECHATSVRGD